MISQKFIYKFFSRNEQRFGEHDILRHIHDIFTREMDFSHSVHGFSRSAQSICRRGKALDMRLERSFEK